MRSAAGDPMRPTAGDPDLEHLFHPQLTDEDGNRTMVREAGGDSIEIRCAFAVTLACVLVEFSKAASAAEIYEMCKAWPLVHAKNQSRWRRQSQSWSGAGPAGARLGWAPDGWDEQPDDSDHISSPEGWDSCAFQRRGCPSAGST